MKIERPRGRRRVVTSEQMRALDRRATEEFSIPSLLLMENAGRAVYEAGLAMLGDTQTNEAHILIVCGQGNNGGDGFVAARHFHNSDARVTVAYFGDRAKARGDALTNIEIVERIAESSSSGLGVAPLSIVHNPDEGFWKQFWGGGVDLVIDALLGTGAKGEVREPLTSVIDSITGFGRVLSVDVPSGIDADTGQVLGRAVQADVTVTFDLPKIGLLTYPGASYVGDLVVAEIGIPIDALRKNDCHVFLASPAIALTMVADRRPDSHKGTYGHVAIIAGSVGLTGATTLAAKGALRIGTGLVTVACPESLNDILEVKLTEAMTIPVPEGSGRAFGMASLRKVLEIIEKRDAVVLGPGFGRDDDTVSFTLELIPKLDKPTIIDADALYAISKDLSVIKKSEAPLVITPHPGEMATLLGTSTAEVQSNRLETAREFAKEHGVTVVLKGAGTVVAEPGGDAYINTTGTPGMATGGTGDVLSGMIGGLLAQGIEPVGAACAGVYLHGRAGEIAAENLGEAAMLASDLADCIGDAMQELQSDTV